MRYSERESRKHLIRVFVDEGLHRPAVLVRFGRDHLRQRFCRVPTYELEELFRDMCPEEHDTMAQAALLTIPLVRGAEQAFSLDNLTARDREVLLEHMKTSLGGPYPSLEEALEQSGMTPVALYHSLRHSTSLPLMIAAAALRSIKRLPDDTRLNPAPHRKAPVKNPRTDEERARSPRSIGLPTSSTGGFLDAVAPNPKRRGSASWDRYQLYEVGLSRTELLARGLRSADLKYDTDHGFVSWRTTREPQPSEDDKLQAIADDAAADAEGQSDE